MSERVGMRPTTLAGMLVVAGIGIGAMLSAILPELPFGIGNGWSGLGNTPGKTKSETAEQDKSKKSDDQAQSTEAEKTKATGPGPGEIEAPEVIYVLINGRDYLLRKGPEDRVSQKPAKLREVIAAAKQATGDENGIRVRIYQTTTAKTLALNALMDELAAAKIPRGAIRDPDAPLQETQ